MKPPRRNFRMMWKVAQLRGEGLTYRDIARKLRKDLKSVYRWSRYDVGSYPQLLVLQDKK